MLNDLAGGVALGKASRLIVYSDGASRGNPGPSAAAFIALTDDGRVATRGTKFLGLKTNNQAEYSALILALQSVSALTREVVCRMDSQLVVKQLNGEYAVKDCALKSSWNKISELRRVFSKVSFVHVPRTEKYVQEVDELANQVLDKACKA